MAALFGTLAGVEMVGQAEEALAALVRIETRMADLVVTESQLSNGTGMELLVLLAQGMPHVIVMVLTNHSGAWLRRACLMGGAQHLFDKTSELDLAPQTIQRIACEHRTRALSQSGAHHV